MASPRATARAHAISVPTEWPSEKEHLRKIADAVNLICQTLGLNVTPTNPVVIGRPGTVPASRKLIADTGNANEVTVTFNNSDDAPGTAIVLQLQFTGSSPDDNTALFLECQDTTTARLKIFADGDVQNHDNSYGAISDGDLKQDVVDANPQGPDIDAYRFVYFRFKSDVDAGRAKVLFGLVAQEVEQVSPGLVTTDDKGQKGIRYSVLCLKAVKALQETRTALRGAFNRINTLEDQMTALTARVAALEAVKPI